MPNYAPHWRLQMSGELTDQSATVPDEIWSCSINLIPVDFAEGGETAYLADIAPKLGTWFKDPANYMANAARLTSIKFNKINSAGDYADPTTTHRRDYTTSDLLTGGKNPTQPMTSSLCYSWLTANQRGPGSRGRIYPPNFVFPGNTEFVTGQEQYNVANSAKSLLVLLSAPAVGGQGTWIPVVASGTNATNSPITAVAIGSRMDTQRRRSNALKEQYVRVLL